MGFLKDMFNSGNPFGGDKGDIVNNILDPGGNFLESAGFDLGGYGDAREDVSNWMDDLGDTNEYLTENRRRNYKENNGFERDFLTGFSGFGGSSLGTKFTNEVYGKEDKPMWDMYGGFTQDDYQYAENQGQDTSNKQGLHSIGGAVGKGFLNAFTGGLGSTAIDGLNNYGMGESNDDLWKTALANYYGNTAGEWAAGANVAGEAGMTGQYRNVTNNAVGGAAAGGTQAGIMGDSIAEGALQGGVTQLAKGGANMAAGSLMDMYGGMDDMDPFDERNMGTLGGTMENQYGERSTPGNLIPEQAQANAQANLGLPQGAQLPTETMRVTQGMSGGSPAVQAFLQAVQGGGGSPKASVGDFGDLAGNLLGMYNARKQRQGLRDQQRNLQELFSSNSPYAQQMRQRLERKDAAAGRRSQYGARETELAARLAEQQAKTFPQQERYEQGIGGLDNAFLNNLLRSGRNVYQNGGQWGDSMENGANVLMNMFRNGGR
jgi:hypothetical protein